MDMEQAQPREQQPDTLKEAFEWMDSFMGVLVPLMLLMALVGRPATEFP